MKKKNPSDLTLRNLRAMKKLFKSLTSRLARLEVKIKLLEKKWKLNLQKN